MRAMNAARFNCRPRALPCKPDANLRTRGRHDAGVTSKPQPAAVLPDVDVRVAPLERPCAEASAKLAARDRCEAFPAHHDRDLAADADVLGRALEVLGSNLTRAHVGEQLLARKNATARSVDAQIAMSKSVETCDVACCHHRSLLFIDREDSGATLVDRNGGAAHSQE